MIRRPSRRRAFRSAAAWLLALALIGLVLPASSLARTRDVTTVRPEVAANDCPTGDSAGPTPGGPFSISGQLTDGSGVGIADIRVRASALALGGGFSDATTNAEGFYVITELSDAEFQLGFFDWSGVYQSGFLGSGEILVIDPALAAPVDAGGDPTNVDIVLPAEPDPLLSVSGRLLDDAGDPVSGAEVRASSPDFPLGGCGVSDENGLYQMPEMRVGRYVVTVTSETQPTGFYAISPPTNFVTHHTDATMVTVANDVAGIDIRFPPTFTLSGTIANTLGDPVEGIFLTACEEVEGGLCSHATSESDGSYSIGRLVEGSYVIRQDDQSLTYTSGYHVAGPDGVVADRSLAKLITVAGDVSDVSLLAVANPRITGTITSPTLAALEGIEVSACSLPDSEVCGSASTGANGTFAVSVDPGTYALRVFDSSGDHPSGYVGVGSALVVAQGDARDVVVGASDVSIGTVAFVAGARISGTIQRNGSPASVASFGVCPTEFDCTTGGNSDENGIFRSDAVVPGSYKLGGDTDEGERVWYVLGGPPVADFALGTSIPVGTTEVTGIVFDVTFSGSGTPTPDGPNVTVVPTDPTTGATPVTLTFDNVNLPGETSLTISDSGPGGPAGFQLGLPPTYFDISTTADFDGSEVTICISYAGVSFPDESMLRLFHYDTATDAWEDRTFSQDLVNDVICARTASFSPFAIFQRTMAFTGFRAPIVSPPAVNRAIAGDTVPLGFGLGGDFGSSVLASGSPASQQRDCATGAPIGPIEATTSADKKDVLRYDKVRGLYVYNWKTNKAWNATCRQLILTFSNDTTAEASFDFRPEPKPPKPPKPPKGN